MTPPAPSILVINGPNLNLLGTRKPEVYGRTTLADVEKQCQADADRLGLELIFKQSNHEGDLVDWIHETGFAVKAGDPVMTAKLAGLELRSLGLTLPRSAQR